MVGKTTDLCDACEGARAANLYFRGFGLRRAFAGAIRTVLYRDGFSLVRDAVHQSGHGKVLVIDGAGQATGALFGDVMAGIAARNGWAGVVVNGAIRDTAEIDTMDIGVKALGTLPNRASLRNPGEMDLEVRFGDIAFPPGAWLVADEDGVVVLPPGLTGADIDISQALKATALYAAGAA
ncbi:MAG: ribonuclease E activity regulator RraA [Ottowia sp.]|uniref:ribonuclease E activity regulator RraA n=1 Tax=Ottowia sp. TaxID=1898956 RepID=UPI003C733838